MALSGSPTVRRRRLAAELRRLRGSRTGGEVARAVGWSNSKVSRAESGRESFPPSEVRKLIDYFGVGEPLRSRLLALAADAAKRGWWDEYADAIGPGYLEFIGLEAEATATFQWQSDVIPGLLQTEAYSRQIDEVFKEVSPTTPPAVHEKFLQVRARRQRRLTEEPPLRLSVVMDQAVLLRAIGDREVMRGQLAKLIETSGLANVQLRILPLAQNSGLVGASFAILSFGDHQEPGASSLADVVSTESLNTEVYVEGQAETHFYTLFAQALAKAALDPERSRDLISSTIEQTWS